MSKFRGVSAVLAALAASAGGLAYASEKTNKESDKPSVYEDSGTQSGNFLSSRFARSQGDKQSAIRYLEESLLSEPTNHRIAGQLLVLYLNEGEMDKALEKAAYLKEDPKRELIVDLLLAVEDVHNARLVPAREKLRHVFNTGDSSVWLPLFTSWIALGTREVKKPFLTADVLPKGEKAPTFLSYHMAVINDLAGFKETAQKQYEAAIADHARAPFRAVEAAADFYRRNRMTDKLAQIKLDYINAHPSMSALVDSETAAQMASLIAQTSKEKSRGGRLINDTNEGIAEVLFTMASVLYTLDAGQDTQLYLRMALYLRPDFPLAQLLLGNALEQEGKFMEAADLYGNINPDSPLSERALLRKAFMVERMGKLEEALTMLDQRAEEDPKDYDAFVAKGDLLRARSKFPEAVEAYTAALARIPEVGVAHWGIFFARGACFERLGTWDKAEADLRKALSLSHDQPEVLNYLGYGLLMQGDNPEEARKLIEQAYSLQPNSPQVVDSLGWALYKTGDVEGAVQLLEQAIEMMPGDATVNDHLGDAYWQAGRKTEARFQWQRALSFSPEPALADIIQRKLKEGLDPIVVRKADQSVHAQSDLLEQRTN